MVVFVFIVNWAKKLTARVLQTPQIAKEIREDVCGQVALEPILDMARSVMLNVYLDQRVCSIDILLKKTNFFIYNLITNWSLFVPLFQSGGALGVTPDGT